MRKLARDVADQRRARDPTDAYHTRLFELGDGTVIAASAGGNSARWINHGRDPNCEAIEYDDGRIFIHAKRTMAGEELLYSVRVGYDDRMTQRAKRAFACRCRRTMPAYLLSPQR